MRTLDLLALDKEDDLRVMWLDASKDMRDKTLESFYWVIYIRESFGLL